MLGIKKHKLALTLLIVPLLLMGTFFAASPHAAAAPAPDPTVTTLSAAPQPKAKHPCGGGDKAVEVSIDFGCRGVGNPVADMAFAIIRFLSQGVGLVIIGSIIVGGIQYSASRGEPQATAAAIKRIQSTLMALLLYIFGYAILNYLIPGQFLK
jgi:hypothetical protein